jgi:signal transduction histidine kinase
MVSMSEHTEQSFYESGFRDEVEQLYVQEVAPALLEIQEALQANAYPRQFLSAATEDLKTILTGVITFGVTRATELPPLIAGGAAVLTAAAQAAWEKSREAHRIKEHQFYFLYRTQDILGK